LIQIPAGSHRVAGGESLRGASPGAGGAHLAEHGAALPGGMREDSREGGREGASSVGARRHRRFLRASPQPYRSSGGSLSPPLSGGDEFGRAPELRGGTRRARHRRRRCIVEDEDAFELRHRRRARVCDDFGGSRSQSPPRGFRRDGRAPAGRARDFSPGQASDDSKNESPLRGGRRQFAQDAYETPTTGVNAIPLGARDSQREPLRTPSVVDQEFCLDFKRGKCRFGETCKYSHGDGKVEGAKIEVCMDFQRGKCRFMENCKFSHGEADAEAARNKKTHRVWVMHTDCAKVIGKGGRAMREVEGKTGTLLKVQPERDMESTGADKERYVDISGTKENCEAAVQLILERTRYLREDCGKVLKDVRRSDDGLEELPRVIEVKPEDVGRVIGRKGDMIKFIEQKSSTKIEVDKVTGKLEIFGKTEAQSQALELVLAEITFAKDVNGTVIKEDSNKKDGEGTAKLAPRVLWIKDEHAGRVIGRGGGTIHDMMKRSGADIKIRKLEEMPAARGGPREREIRIFGEKEQQDQAMALLLNELCWCRDSGGVLKDVPDERQTRKRKKEEQRASQAKLEDDKAGHAKSKRRGGGSSALWVCATCGGEHRSKECPYAIGMGMKLGMQMGMQAMGMALPPGMPPIPGMLPMMPGMHPMMGLPRMPGMLPGGPSRSSQAPREESEYSSESSSSADSRSPSIEGDSGFAMSNGPDRPRAHRDSQVVRPSNVPGLSADHMSQSRNRKTRGEQKRAVG